MAKRSSAGDDDEKALPPRKSVSLIGHKARVFDVRYLQDAQGSEHLLSSSEDGSSILWNLKTRRAAATLIHAKDNEVLRAEFLSRDCPRSIFTCGADGLAILWSRPADGAYQKSLILDHQGAQIYACIALPSTDGSATSTSLISAADGILGLWDLGGAGGMTPRTWSFDSVGETYMPSSTCEAQAGAVPPRWLLPGVKPDSERDDGEDVDYISDSDDYESDEEEGEDDADIDEEYVSGAEEEEQEGEGKREEEGAEKATDGQKAKQDSVQADGEEKGEGEAARVSYGGDRNPNKTNYVFDVNVSTVDAQLLALALSDGSVCTLDLREPEHSSSSSSSSSSGEAGLTAKITQKCNIHDALIESKICAQMQLRRSNTTGVTWTHGDKSLLVTLGSGGVAVLDPRMSLRPRAYLHGHSAPCYGSVVTSGGSSSSSTECISWSGEGVVNEWSHVDSLAGLLTKPRSQHKFKDYPVLSCCVMKDGAIGCGGGGGNASFLGTPLHLLSGR